MRWTKACALAFACAACGGAPAKSADDATPAGEAAESPEPTASPPAEAEPAAEQGGNTGPKDEQPGEASDVQAVLQLVIDDEALTPYLHLEKPERFPLRVATRNLPSGIQLEKSTQPVVLVDNPDADKKPVLVFMEVDVKKDTASVRYRYDVEGIRGACTLERRDGRWVLKKSRVTER